MRHDTHLGAFHPVELEVVEAEAEAFLSLAQEDQRLMTEATRRMLRLKRGAQSQTRVPSGRHAPPNLREGGQGGDRASQPSPRASDAPNVPDMRLRPRVLSLGVVFLTLGVVPSITSKLLIWALIALLVSAVLLGPERVRDALHQVVRSIVHSWRPEIHFLRSLLMGRRATKADEVPCKRALRLGADALPKF